MSPIRRSVSVLLAVLLLLSTVPHLAFATEYGDPYVTLGTFSATGTVFELIVDGKKMSGRLDSIRTLFSGFFPVISYEVICF